MLKDKKLALFFTTGVSLKTWDKIGNIEREIKPYNELADYFNKIYFFTYGDNGDLKYRNILNKNIEILPKKWKIPSKLYSLLLPLLYRKELKEIDFLKTNQMNGAIAAVLTKWFYKKKLIVRCGYEWLNLLEKSKSNIWKKVIACIIEKIVYQSADKIILTSERDKKYIELKFNIPSFKIKVNPNYIDTELFKPVSLKKEEGRICFVGRLEKEKNLFNLIKAISSLSVKLIIFGSGSLKKDLENYVEKQKVNVEFKGNIPNQKLPEDLNKSILFVLPSFYEGCPKTLLEAMACELPCIGTDVEGIREIIKHKENGYLCDTDAPSIRKAIFDVLSNEELRIKLSKNARKTIVEHFSLESNLKKEREIYELL
ncbi:MAG: glycosyltransferase family 4 protein [Promethearchaeota archaeon]